jgi:hypothetical protein
MPPRIWQYRLSMSESPLLFPPPQNSYSGRLWLLQEDRSLPAVLLEKAFPEDAQPGFGQRVGHGGVEEGVNWGIRYIAKRIKNMEN